MTRNQAARHWFLRTALAYLGTPYRWGGDDPSGFDCSGFVVECLRSAGLPGSGDYTADDLMRYFADCRVTRPDRGCLVFRLDSQGRAQHVSICLDRWFQIGASGGHQGTRDLSQAWQHNAFVKIRRNLPEGPRRRICDPFMSQKG